MAVNDCSCSHVELSTSALLNSTVIHSLVLLSATVAFLAFCVTRQPKQPTTQLQWLPTAACLNLLPMVTRAWLLQYVTSHLGPGDQWHAMSDHQLREAARQVLTELAAASVETTRTTGKSSAVDSAGAGVIAQQSHSSKSPGWSDVNVAQRPSEPAAVQSVRKVILAADEFSNAVPACDDQPAQVVISYQSAQTSFMLRVVAALEARGIRTVDGTRVPPGMDW